VRSWCAAEDERHVAVVSVTVDGMDSDEVGTRLDVDHDVVVRTGLQCAPLAHEDLGTVASKGTVRFGFGPFNTDAHVERALAGLAECAAEAAKRRG
jgi:selenocysteine lyase/cysteine desulfurase